MNAPMLDNQEKLSSSLEKLKWHAAEIMAKGSPFTKDELKVLKIFNSLNGGKAGNAGKRNKKSENERQIKGV